jgi:phosphoglycolate phosphatase-like HAD superfamily hydrolase
LNLLIDLDGTLIDARSRLHELFRFLVPQSDLDHEQYWRLKRAKRSHRDILSSVYGYSESQIAEFESIWMTMIEEPQWLERDVPYDGITLHLDALSKKARLFLLTKRQKSDMVMQQIARFGWKDFFTEILVTGRGGEKYDAVAHLSLTNSDWLIGDTGYDIQVGNKLGVRTAAVSNGFLSAEVLAGYRPDILLPHFVDFDHFGKVK